MKIPIAKPYIGLKEKKYIIHAINSGWISSLGEFIDKFEKTFSEYIGVEYALTTSSGTTALHLALTALGVGSGDEVIIPDLTFVATANAVAYTGAKVVTVDIEEETLCINPEQIEAKITEKTKAIIPVHLYGHPANMEEINKIAKKYNLYVIEDAAEAHGAEIKDKKVGAWGDCAIFSFYGNKIITTGEGGMVVTNNRELYERMRFLRDHAMDHSRRYWHTEVGFNYRMTNIQAAIGLAQLERIEEIIERRIKIFNRYYENLSSLKGIRLNFTANWAKNVYWMVYLIIEDFDYEKRDMFMKKLKAYGIDTRPFFYPISDMPMYEYSTTPVTHLLAQKGVCLPTFHDIKDEEIDYICETIAKVLESFRS
ncbi:MAG: DegT/DnrJ/EryC1/StrS family aminotransferase [Aquificae bacterium]|nr:DegT/DnrJ/EryC1/StrS family aminotransferase [Aquificota bacterium]